MSRMMWDMSSMITQGFRSGIHSGHGQVSMISTGKEWLKSGKKKKQEADEPVSEAAEPMQEAKTEEKAVLEEVSPVTDIHKEDRAARLREAVLWSEILGEPVAKKRQRKRMEQRYGNQSYAGRR